LFCSAFLCVRLQCLYLVKTLCNGELRERLKIVNCSGDCYELVKESVLCFECLSAIDRVVLRL